MPIKVRPLFKSFAESRLQIFSLLMFPGCTDHLHPSCGNSSKLGTHIVWELEVDSYLKPCPRGGNFCFCLREGVGGESISPLFKQNQAHGIDTMLTSGTDQIPVNRQKLPPECSDMKAPHMQNTLQLGKSIFGDLRRSYLNGLWKDCSEKVISQTNGKLLISEGRSVDNL